jgi:hypothetical protein
MGGDRISLLWESRLMVGAGNVACMMRMRYAYIIATLVGGM